MCRNAGPKHVEGSDNRIDQPRVAHRCCAKIGSLSLLSTFAVDLERTSHTQSGGSVKKGTSRITGIRGATESSGGADSRCPPYASAPRASPGTPCSMYRARRRQPGPADKPHRTHDDHVHAAHTRDEGW
jgi:hypothetical protein